MAVYFSKLQKNYKKLPQLLYSIAQVLHLTVFYRVKPNFTVCMSGTLDAHLKGDGHSR